MARIPAVITRIHAGLGNQLFEYAVARSVAHRLNLPLYFDLSEYRRADARTYQLDAFRHIGLKVESDEMLPKRQSWPMRQVSKLLRGENSIRRIDALLSHGYDPRLSQVSSSVYLDGFWFSEQYFSDISHLLRQELKVIREVEGENKRFLERIQTSFAVSVHVRRGDFISDPMVAANNAHCSLDYYLRAANLIAENARDNCVFFVFSDEPQWCRDNLRLPGEMCFVDGNSEAQSYEDLRLMSACRCHIIANSTFSWWGAWLNLREDKIVVAPRRWILTSEYFDKYICPASFTVIDN